MENPPTLLERRGAVATIWLNRPERRNAIDAELLRSLSGALDEVRDDPDVRVVVLRGKGPVFSSGIDHSLLGEVFQKSQVVPFRHLHADLHAGLNKMVRMEKPVVAVLHKMAVGMAMELALAADFRLATADCAFGLPEVAFGIVPDVGGTTRLTRLAGPARARELILTGKLISAARAMEWGVVHEVFDGEAALEEGLGRWVEDLSRHPAGAVGMAKTLIDHVQEVGSDAALRLEGVWQSVLMARPELLDNFPHALSFIQSQIKAHRGR